MTQPIANARFRPIIAPTLAPVIISAAMTSVYAVIAPWIPVTVVPTSSATVAIETFITELSRVIRNWPDASVSSTSVAPAARADWVSAVVTAATLSESGSAHKSATGSDFAQPTAAVDGQGVDDEDVDREQREAPERVRRDEHQLAEGVEARGDDAEPASEFAAGGERERGQQLDDAKGRHDPAPRVQVAEDVRGLCDVEARLRDREDAVEEVERAGDAEHDGGEGD